MKYINFIPVKLRIGKKVPIYGFDVNDYYVLYRADLTHILYICINYFHVRQLN